MSPPPIPRMSKNEARGNQRQSEAISFLSYRGHQRPSDAIRPHLRCNQTKSDAIRRNQTQSDAIRRNQTQSDAIRRNQHARRIVIFRVFVFWAGR